VPGSANQTDVLPYSPPNTFDMSGILDDGDKAAHNDTTTVNHVNVGSSSNSDYDKNTETGSLKQHDTEIADLARKFTTQSAQHDLGSPFDAPEGGGLDPRSDQFRAKDWAKAFYNLRYESEDVIPRVAGVAFSNLNVWGEGSPTDFQSTVGNKILKLPSLFGRGIQKIEILQNLDGLLLPGEQLCVLGPPG
jgi:ATP-binding cassette subfamily G (WHITE) protein 2 (PDR)